MHLSTGKLVSERIFELLEEVNSRGMVPCEILLGETADRLLPGGGGLVWVPLG